MELGYFSFNLEITEQTDRKDAIPTARLAEKLCVPQWKVRLMNQKTTDFDAYNYASVQGLHVDTAYNSPKCS